jgi:rare lipoprotein A
VETLPRLAGALTLAGLAAGAAGAVAAGVTVTVGHEAAGKASWYGEQHHGRRTASGEPFDMYALTAAHPTLPFGTRVRVTHARSGRSVEVRINDRGPRAPGRILDLSYAAARALGALGESVIPVRIRVTALPARRGRRGGRPSCRFARMSTDPPPRAGARASSPA